MHNTIVAIEQSIDPDGLVAFWPRARGNVSLTAWAYSFLVAAQKAGEPVDKALSDRLATVLKLALRSDYARLIDGEELRERVEALTALAAGGKLDEAYVAELGRRAESDAERDASRKWRRRRAGCPAMTGASLDALVQDMWSRVKISLPRRQAKSMPGQAADDGNADDPAVRSEEPRAEMTRGGRRSPRPTIRAARVLRDGLIRLGDGDGWGSTNANSAAVRALAAVWKRPAAQIPVTVAQGAATRSPGAQRRCAGGARSEQRTPAPVRIDNGGAAPIVALADTRYLPDGARLSRGGRRRGLRRDAHSPIACRRATRRSNAIAPDARRRDPSQKPATSSRKSSNSSIRRIARMSRSRCRWRRGSSRSIPSSRLRRREATPSFAPTLAPTWTAFDDDRVFYAYDIAAEGQLPLRLSHDGADRGQLSRSRRARRRRCIRREFMARAPDDASSLRDELEPLRAAAAALASRLGAALRVAASFAQ